jgi:asparaginyl-tRNA synthetase
MPDRHYLTVIEDPWYRAVVRLQDTITVATTDFWSRRGALTLHLPITTGSISSPMGLGSDSSPVLVDLAGVPTYLADSMQFMLEYGCRLSADGCYYVMPSFRGEDADDRHLCQFFHSEAEIPGGLDNVIDAVESYVRFLIMRIIERHADDVRTVTGDIDHLERALEQRFTRLTFDDAVEMLSEDGGLVEQHDGWRTLTRSGEQQLLERVGQFVWVTEMDHLSVPFYQAFADETLAKAANADLLFGIGEVVGAGERHATAEQLVRALEMHDVGVDEYAWYAEMKERYPIRTAGFGMGGERFLLWVLRHDDIRDIPLLLRFNGQQILP